MSKTKAELEAELETLRAERDAALEAANTQRAPRERYGFGIWPNNNRRSERDPAWRGTVRLVVPEDAHPGDALWIDTSLWSYDPDSSPVTYAQNPPVFSGSISPCPAARARELEADRKKALRERGLIH